MDSRDKNPPPKSNLRGASLARLSLYLRELRRMTHEGSERTSSAILGKRLGVSADVVRRDLATLGQLGRRGQGYEVAPLAKSIRGALGADQTWNVALVGAGSLGTALLRYRGFAEQGFHLVAAFDIRSDRIGETIGGVPVYDLESLEAVIDELQINLAILAVPAESAAATAQRLQRGGIAGILNFAPLSLGSLGPTAIANVDLASELQQLSFTVARLHTELPETDQAHPFRDDPELSQER